MPRPQDYMPGYVDPLGPAQQADAFSMDRARAEMMGLPAQVGRFGRAAMTGLSHLPYDATGGMLDLLNMAGNVAVPGQPFATDYRSKMIEYMADQGLTQPEPTGADIPGYLFGGIAGPGAASKTGSGVLRALEGLPDVKTVQNKINQILPKGKSYDIEHYAPAQRELLDPGMAGTNQTLRGAEGARDPLDAVYGYDLGQPYQRESQLGASNEVMRAKARRIINTDDPKYLQIKERVNVKLEQEAAEAAAGRWAPSVDPAARTDALERAVEAAGYHGTRTQTPTGAVVKSFQPMQVTGRGRAAIPGEVTDEKIAQYIATNPEGTTISPQGVVPSEGIAVARPPSQGGEQIIRNPELSDIASYVGGNKPRPGEYYGSWKDPESGDLFMDQTRVNPQDARLRSRLQGELGYQKSLWDIGAGEEVPLLLRNAMESRAANLAQYPANAPTPGSLRAQRGKGLVQPEKAANYSIPAQRHGDDLAYYASELDSAVNARGAYKDMPEAERLAQVNALETAYAGLGEAQFGSGRLGDMARGASQRGAVGERQTPSGLPAFLNEDVATLSARPDVPQSSLVRPVPPRGDPESIQRLYSAPNIHRVEGLVEEGQRMGGDAWYNTMPLRQAYIDELGEVEGAQRFAEYIDRVAATSPRSTVEANVRRASHFQTQAQQGIPLDVTGAQPPAPYGHLAHKTQVGILQDIENLGELDAAKRLKTASFAENLKGTYAPLTADAHYARGIDLRKASGLPETQSPSKTQYRGVEAFGKDIAKEMGMSPAQMQANLWMGAGAQTGVANPQIFMSAFNNVLAKTASLRGISQKQALKDFLTGKIPFLTVSGASVTGQMLQGQTDDVGSEMEMM